MLDNIYDIIIAGGGVAGAFAAYKLSKSKVSGKICLLEFGRPPGKRRKQLEGWFGCFPTGNSRLYTNDLEKISNISGPKQTEKANNFVTAALKEHGPCKTNKSKKPNQAVIHRLDSNGYNITYNDFLQWKPENVHCLSKYIADEIEQENKIEMFFDVGISNITKKDNLFIIETEAGSYKTKKLILCIGRSGWRLTSSILKNFGLIQHDDFAYFGFRGEISSSYMKEWNGSHCTVSKENLIVGPLSWSGTIIPEDHVDLVVASWRSNEDRWHSDRVSFSVIMKEKFEGKGVFQTERLSKLAFVLADSRVGKIKASEYLTGTNDLSLIPEYSWFKTIIKEMNSVIPNFSSRGFLNVPDIIAPPPIININKDFSTDVEGLYVAGESAGVRGIISAAVSGVIAASNIGKTT